MKYQGAWFNPAKNEMEIIEFEPNDDWEPYEKDQKAIEAVHKGADAQQSIFSYVHAIEWYGLRVRCLTHRVGHD